MPMGDTQNAHAHIYIKRVPPQNYVENGVGVKILTMGGVLE